MDKALKKSKIVFTNVYKNKITMKYSLIAALFLIASQVCFAMDNSDPSQDSHAIDFDIQKKEEKNKGANNDDFDFDMNEFYDSDEDHDTDSEKAPKRVRLTSDHDGINNNNNNNDEKQFFFCEVAECKKAAKPYKGLSGLWYHMRSAHKLPLPQKKESEKKDPEKPFKCPHPGCDKSFDLERSISRHLSINHNHEVKNICHFCAAFPEKVQDKDLLDKPHYDCRDFFRHLRTHTKPYQCNVCAKRIALQEAFVMHEKTKHGITNNAQQTREGSAKFFCTLCGLELLTDLQTHKASCRTSLKYALTTMGILASEENLAKIGFNDNKYIDIPKFKCLICNALCKNKKGFIHHMIMMHRATTSNGFKCPVCSLLCKNQTGLTNHMTISGHKVITPILQAPRTSTPTLLLLNPVNQDDRITNAHDDPSHQIQLNLNDSDDPFICIPPKDAFLAPK